MRDLIEQFLANLRKYAVPVDAVVPPPSPSDFGVCWGHKYQDTFKEEIVNQPQTDLLMQVVTGDKGKCTVCGTDFAPCAFVQLSLNKAPVAHFCGLCWLSLTGVIGAALAVEMKKQVSTIFVPKGRFNHG